MHIKRLTRWVPRLTFSRVIGGTAILVLVSAGGAYAANEWTGANIVDGSLTGADLASGTVASVDIADGSVSTTDILNETITSQDIKNGTITGFDIRNSTIGSPQVANDSLTANDLAGDSVNFSELATDSVQATEIADNSIDAGEIVDFGLSNQDVGVLFAQINADGSVANSSGGVTSFSLGTGTYEVNFGVDISFCAFVTTQGEASAGGAGGAIMGATDRSGNGNAAFVTARSVSGSLINTAFQLVVVC